MVPRILNTLRQVAQYALDLVQSRKLYKFGLGKHIYMLSLYIYTLLPYVFKDLYMVEYVYTWINSC